MIRDRFEAPLKGLLIDWPDERVSLAKGQGRGRAFPLDLQAWPCKHLPPPPTRNRYL